MVSSNAIIMGNYRPMDSFLHRLDARAKMMPVMLVLVLALLTYSYIFYSLLLLSLIAALLLSGVGAGSLARNYKPIIALVLVTALYHLLFTSDESSVLWSVAGFDLTVGAIDHACFFSLRLLLFVSVAFLVTLTNSPSELAEGIARLMKPLARLKVPVNDLALILFIALRFIPILTDEFHSIRNAQLIRGADYSGSWFNRIRRMASLLLPLFVSSIARADDLALAIESRGYDGRAERTSFGQRNFGSGEYTFMFGTTILIFALFYLTGDLWLSAT